MLQIPLISIELRVFCTQNFEKNAHHEILAKDKMENLQYQIIFQFINLHIKVAMEQNIQIEVPKSLISIKNKNIKNKSQQSKIHLQLY